MLIVWIALGVIGFLFLASVFISYYLSCLAMKRHFFARRNSVPSEVVVGLARNMPKIQAGIEAFYAKKPELISIKSEDGITLSAYYLKTEGAEKTAILMHGYRSKEGVYDFAAVFQIYQDMGYHVLIPDERSHGKSEGDYITFGLKERFDVLSWVKKIEEEYHSSEIVLHGVSMGAATVLMATGLSLPRCVTAVVADSGFTSPFEILRYLLHEHHAPAFPILWGINLFSKLWTGVWFSEYSTIRALENNDIPILLIHGGQDSFVPKEMTEENQKAAKGESEFLFVKEAGHALACFADEEAYRATLVRFLQTYSEI